MSCTIIIFHFESLAYLRAVIRQIQKFQREDIPVQIIIADQSADASVRDVVHDEFKSVAWVIDIPRCGSGFSIDYIMRNYEINTEFVCTIDVDTIPIHRNWLYVPIQLIRQTDFAWVGVHAQIENHYAHMGDFFCMCQHFRVARTDTYRDLAFNAGFCKNDSRHKLVYNNNEWKGWSDDAIIAHWWEDQYRKNNKLTLAVTHFLGIAPTEGRYGRYTDDLVLHVGFSYNYKMVRNAKECMGEEFLALMEKINHFGLTDEILEDMIKSLKPLDPPVIRLAWDATNKSCYTPNSELNKLIDNLKEE